MTPLRKAGMLHAKRDLLGVLSATEYYPMLATLTVEMHDAQPAVKDLNDWDAAAEISYDFKEAVFPKETLDMYPEPLSDDLGGVEVPPGQYRVRAYAKKLGTELRPRPQSHIDKDPEFDEDETLITSDILEEFLVQFWIHEFEQFQIPEPAILKDHPEYVL